MAKTDRAALAAFFTDYARATLEDDAATIMAAYADTYIATAPQGVESYAVDRAYAKQLHARSRAMRELGLSVADARVETVTRLDPLHVLVRVDWTLTFQKEGRGIPSAFAQTYVLRRTDEGFKILLYISHDDEEAVMARDGVT